MKSNRAKVGDEVKFLLNGKEVTGVVSSSDWPQAVVRVPANQFEGKAADAADAVVRVLHSDLKGA